MDYDESVLQIFECHGEEFSAQVQSLQDGIEIMVSFRFQIFIFNGFQLAWIRIIQDFSLMSRGLCLKVYWFGILCRFNIYIKDCSQ